MVRDESNRAAERTKKQNQRFREKCPDVVPPSVPPLSVNESEREVVPEVALVLETFDAEKYRGAGTRGF
jgi:hypothetical protein